MIYESALESIRERVTGLQRENTFRLFAPPMSMDFKERQTGNRLPRIDRSDEHELQLLITSRFWANDAQYSSAKEQARRLLADCLYSDVLRALAELQSYIASGDQDMSAKRCGELRAWLTR